MVGRKHRVFVFLKVNDVNLLRFAAWLAETRAALKTMCPIPEPVKPVCNFSLAKVDSGIALR